MVTAIHIGSVSHCTIAAGWMYQYAATAAQDGIWPPDDALMNSSETSWQGGGGGGGQESHVTGQFSLTAAP